VQPLQPKQMVPDYVKSQHENHSHSRTCLPDYHDDSAANVINSAFYSKCVTVSGLIATSKQNHPVIFLTQSIRITSHVVHFELQKQKISVYFAARGIALLWLFFHLNCSVSGFVHL